MSETQRRMVFRDPVRAEVSILDLQAESGWSFEEAIPADPERFIPYELVLRTSDGRTSIHYVDDRLVKFPYVIVKGELDEVERIAGEIRQKVDLYPEEEILTYAAEAKTRAQKMEALAFLAVTAPPQHDPRYFEPMRRAFTDRDPSVRSTVVWVTGYPSWPEFRPLLQASAAEDDAPEVREAAQAVLAGFDHEGID